MPLQLQDTGGISAFAFSQGSIGCGGGGGYSISKQPGWVDAYWGLRHAKGDCAKRWWPSNSSDASVLLQDPAAGWMSQ